MTSPESATVDNANNSSAMSANTNGNDGQSTVSSNSNSNSLACQATLMSNEDTGPNCPRATLSCRPNSHPFQDRTLSLDQSCKVGRSVARARPAVNNAIFDCKVLSRNHALLWYENGKFYLQDTKSSNGTFVNNQRLSKGSEESIPREVCSGDILQFGVDVMENSRKVTHGCIIATLKLFLPDGKEAKASPTIMSGVVGGVGGGGGHLPPQDLYLLNQYIQEALAREQLLETKLSILQRLVGQTEVASGDAWKALIDEDRLLTRVEILESQLSTYGKNMTEDKLREEVQRLMDEKEEYQKMAKETVTKITDEKLAVARSMDHLQKKLHVSEEEQSLLKELYDKCNEENQKLAEEVAKLSTDLEEAKNAAAAAASTAAAAAAAAAATAATATTTAAPSSSATSALNVSADSQTLMISTDSTSSQIEAAREEVPSSEREAGKKEEVAEVVEKVVEASEGDEVAVLKTKLAELEEENGRLRSERHHVTGDLPDGQQQEEEARRVEEGQKEHEGYKHVLESRLREVLSERDSLELEVERLRHGQQQQQQSPSGSNSNDESIAGDSGTGDPMYDEKLHHLIKVKERYDDVSRVNEELERSLQQLEEEVETLSSQNHVAAACATLPLAVLVLAFVVAYLPTLSAIFGTVE